MNYSDYLNIVMGGPCKADDNCNKHKSQDNKEAI